ncbi:MAG TPA: class I SAM-dependent methyltransferase [Opitutaceae bacterium]|nr:class I SAM-dependent methyltransferase [Opitutaceae bacterium]
MPSSCFICGGTAFARVTPQYRRCVTCGHETLTAHQAQAYMINDALTTKGIDHPSRLDRFQSAVLDRFARGQNRRQLVDIGSGSGKFLRLNGQKFARSTGVEITPEAVNFSQKELGLNIVADFAAVPGEIDAATAWHSLEHFPEPALLSLLEHLRAKIAPDGCVIVSVPNGASFQYRLFRTCYAFFDVPAHLQQFTPDSLERLFARHGFARSGTAVSWPYNVFGYVQGLLNLVIPGHNYLYYRLKRGRPRASLARDVASLCLVPLAAPVALALAVVEAAWPGRQAVLTCCFEKRP